MSKAATDLIVIGVILGAHGVRGDVGIKSFTAEPEALFEYAPFLSETGEILVDPLRARPAKDHYIVSPAKPLQKEEWDGLKGTKLCVPRDALPDTEDDEYYIDDLVGLDVYGGGDTLVFGGRDDDVLSAGDGAIIETGDGRDRIEVDYGIRTGRIRVTDFERGQDKLDYLLLPQDDYGERTVEFSGAGDLSVLTVRTEDSREIIFEITTINGGGQLDESDLFS